MLVTSIAENPCKSRVFHLLDLWYNKCAEWRHSFAAERCFIMDGHPLELLPVYPCSQGTLAVFTVPLAFLWFGENAHGTAHCVRCPGHRLMIWTAPQKSGFFAVFTWFENSCGFCRFSRTRSSPEDRSRRSRPHWCAGCVTSRGDISHSDGHSIFKVQVFL